MRSRLDLIGEVRIRIDALGFEHDARNDVTRGGVWIHPANHLALQVIQSCDATVSQHIELAFVAGRAKALGDKTGVNAIFLIGQDIVEGVQPTYVRLSRAHGLAHRCKVGANIGFDD